MRFLSLILLMVASAWADEPGNHSGERTRHVVETPMQAPVTGALNGDPRILDLVRLFKRLEQRVNDGTFSSGDLESLHKLFQLREVFYTTKLDDYSSGDNLYAQANQLFQRLPAKQKENYELMYGAVAKAKLLKLLDERPPGFRDLLLDLAKEYRNTKSGLEAHFLSAILFMDYGQAHMAHMVLSSIENDPALPKDWKPVIQFRLAQATALSTGDEKAVKAYGVEPKYEAELLAMAKKWKEKNLTMSFGERVASLKPEEQSLYQMARSLHRDAEQRYPRSWEFETARHHLAILASNPGVEQVHVSVRKLEHFPENFKETIPLLLQLSKNSASQGDVQTFFDHKFAKALPVLVSLFEDESANAELRAIALERLILENRKHPRIDLVPLVLKAAQSKNTTFQTVALNALDQLTEDQRVTLALTVLPHVAGTAKGVALTVLEKKQLTDDQIQQLAQTIEKGGDTLTQAFLMGQIGDEKISFKNEVASSLVKLADKWMGVPAQDHMTQMLAVTIYGRFSDKVSDTVIPQLGELAKMGHALGDMAILSLGRFGSRARGELPGLMEKLKTGIFNTEGDGYDPLRPDRVAVRPSPELLGHTIGQIGKGDASILNELNAVATTKQESLYRRAAAIEGVWAFGNNEAISHALKFLEEQPEASFVLASVIDTWGPEKDKMIGAVMDAVKAGKLKSSSAAEFVGNTDPNALQRAYEYEGHCQGVERDRMHQFSKELRTALVRPRDLNPDKAN